MIIRREIPQDTAGITHCHEQAFPGPDEAHLVEMLRENGHISLSLVALHDDQTVGHIVFSPMKVISANGEITEVVALGPVGVLPDHQQQGVGAALCQQGIDICREVGHTAVLVLGHPSYYPRFGFQPAAQFGITCSYDVPPEAFMALELRAGTLADVSGIAHYLPEFDGV